MSDQELIAIIMPMGTIQLEWNSATETVNKSSSLLQKELYQRYVSDPDSWLLYLGFCDKEIALSSSLEFWRRFAGMFVLKLIQTPELETLRHRVQIPFKETELAEFIDTAPFMTGIEYLSSPLLEDTWIQLNTMFSRAIESFEESVASFIKIYSPNTHLVGRVYFHLVENKNADVPFAFLATYTTGFNEAGESKHLPLKYALEEYENDSDKLLELLITVHAAAKQSRLIDQLMDSGELFHPLKWSSLEAFTFLKEIPIYEACGILCRIPNWWKGNASSASLNISLGNKTPSMVGMDALLDFQPQLYLGDVQISEQEARQLLNESQGLAYIKNKWVAVDPEKLNQALAAYQKAKKLMSGGGLSLMEAMRLQLNPQLLQAETGEEGITSVSNGQWLKSIFETLRNPETIEKVTPGKNFKARLRAYQKKGLNWLACLDKLKLGACLADDMGLGKTIQLLAFLNVLKVGSQKNNKPSLLILPASLISNWVSEIHSFSPDLKTFVAHPEMHRPGKVPKLNQKEVDTLDLVITTYTLIQKQDWIKTLPWHYVILDEAQAIKNPGTKQTQAVKKLISGNRIVMTGTPVENRLSDLWSLFDFLNPGLLGTPKEFQTFTKRLQDDATGYARLRKITSPFILRRLKTDKTVISDLPDKVEMKSWVTLGKKQVLLYQELVENLKTTLENSEGIQRRGMVLAALMKFKQLCNHPDQFLGTGNFAENESGKFERLKEICETIYEKREKVLVFTQFKEMTAPLDRFLEKLFERKGLVLHGSVPVGKRKEIIEDFQGSEYIPFMVLSLKAGGVGLNLTAANHVIHFDRWWNPAVENQATDRAFRIGQKKNVMVHKFITKGSVEEKIDRMLEEKAALSNEVVASGGEKWITEMENEELLDLFRLN